MDRLDTLLLDQRKLFGELHPGVNPDNLTPEQKQAFFNKFILAVHEETTELLKTTNYKSHDKRMKMVKRGNTVLEIVDVFKYLMNLCVINEIDANELFLMEREKTAVVRQRYRQQQINFSAAPIVMVDIDGVLADYPQSFYNFVNKKLGTSYDPEKQNDYDICRAMGLTREKYEELKFEYRESGYKRDIDTIDGAVSSMKILKDSGFLIVVFTARPVSEHNRIEIDTYHWLEKNQIPFDALLFAEKKHEELAKFYKHFKPICFIEDSESNADYLSNDGINVVLFNKPYQHNKKFEQRVVRIDTWDQALLEVYKYAKAEMPASPIEKLTAALRK